MDEYVAELGRIERRFFMHYTFPQIAVEVKHIRIGINRLLYEQLLASIHPDPKVLNYLTYDPQPRQIFRCPGIEVFYPITQVHPLSVVGRKRKTPPPTIRFRIHDFPGVAHLDLAETYFDLLTTLDKYQQKSLLNKPLYVLERKYRPDFVKECVRNVLFDLLSYAKLHADEERVSRLWRSFICYAHMTACLEEREASNIINNCSRILRNSIYTYDPELPALLLRKLCNTEAQRSDFLKRHDDLEILEYVLKSFRVARLNVRHFFRHDSQGAVSTFCPVRIFFPINDIYVKKLKILLRFGLEPVKVTCQDDLISLQDRFKSLMREKGLRIISHHRFRRIFVGPSQAEMIVQGMTPETARFRARRYDFTMEFLFMVISANPQRGIYCNSLRCAKLFFSCTTDPFITRNEVLRALNAFCSERHHEAILRRCSTHFREVFSNVLTPRKLEHLCCYYVRRQVIDNFQSYDILYNWKVVRNIIPVIKLNF